jgi:hypothetical protein
VTPHRLCRPLRISGSDLFEDLMMLVIRSLHFSSLHQAELPKKVQFIEQP